MALLAAALASMLSAAPADTIRASVVDTASRPSGSWLPMEVHRWTLSELADTAPLAPSLGPTAAPKDTSKLKIEGSKTIKIGVGSSGGMALDQTLQLSAEGDLAPGIHMKARISDGNLPLSSTGSSTTLREVDELWVEVWSDHWGTRLGDMDWVLGPGLGSGFQRRLRGWSGTWKPAKGDTVTVAIGGPLARWKHVVLTGVEGQQEGYVLVSSSTSTTGAIVPGSERVRVNGELVTRGGDADYSVRYSSGLLDFTTRRRIRASDRIEVEFQATDLDYDRTFVGASVKGIRGSWGWEAWGAREGDQSASPLSYSADTTTQRILGAVGADTSKAYLVEVSGTDTTRTKLPLPQQTGEAGFRLKWGDSTAWFASDLRGSSLDRNVLSTVDARLSGVFGASEAGMRWGDYLASSGLGRWTLRTRGEVLQSTYHGLSAADTLGSTSSDWAGNLTADTGTGRIEGLGSLSWEVEQGMGVWGGLESREAGPAYLTLATAKVGIDRGSDRQMMTKASWSRRDDGVVPLDLDRGKARVSWVFGSFAPQVEADAEVHDARVGDSASRRFSRWGLWGGKWTDPTGWTLDLQGNARVDASDFSGRASGGRDTAVSYGAKGAAKFSRPMGTLDLDADWTHLRKRAEPQFPWTVSNDWLGEATVSAAPVPGLRATGRWKLSTSSYQPEVAVYDTVAAGAGAYIYDSTLREVVASDKGNLRWAGMKLDTSKPAVHASTRLVSAEVEVVPGKIAPSLHGFLADLGARLRMEVQQVDSSGNMRLLPDFSDDALGGSPQGQSEYEATLWWTRRIHRLEGTLSRRLSMGMTTTGVREREMLEQLTWTTNFPAGHRFALSTLHGDLWESEPGYHRHELRWRADPSLVLRVAKPVEIKPGCLVQAGSGSDDGAAFNSLLRAPYLGASVQMGLGLRFTAEVRRATIEETGSVGSRLTEGYSEGTTWRGTAGLDWSWKDKVQARGTWTLRLEPGQAVFQKLSLDARAAF